MEKSERLQKYISQCGIASRRAAEEMIRCGRVTVNGQRASLGDTIVPGVHRVAVDGKVLKERHRPEKTYIMLNKPRGYVTTLSDEQGRKCVADLVEDCGTRVFPVGRLDRDSEGLLILTNDGDFANRISHPSRHVGKTYRVSVRPEATREQMDSLRRGVMVDGQVTGEAKVKELPSEAGKSLLQITIYEGRNRQIRKMCARVGLEVARLKRVAVGDLGLGKLPPGKWRALTKPEITLLLKNASAEKDEPGEKGEMENDSRKKSR